MSAMLHLIVPIFLFECSDLTVSSLDLNGTSV